MQTKRKQNNKMEAQNEMKLVKKSRRWKMEISTRTYKPHDHVCENDKEGHLAKVSVKL